MTTIVLFHHAAGLTDGVRALAHRLEAAGHLVFTLTCTTGTASPPSKKA